MSEPSAARLRVHFAEVSAVTVIHDPDGTRALVEACRGCDLVAFISVLHHIPDYVAEVARLVTVIAPGGTFSSARDPLWYPRRSRAALTVDRGSYLAWRATQGNVRRGLATRLRRLRRHYDESNPSDMVEYHVIRSGVDEEALAHLLATQFESVDIWKYWSTQSAWLQTLGDRLGWTSTSRITATGRQGEGLGPRGNERGDDRARLPFRASTP